MTASAERVGSALSTELAGSKPIPVLARAVAPGKNANRAFSDKRIVMEARVGLRAPRSALGISNRHALSALAS
ncbi:hypothetical protein BURKHO8Y_70036 [Burkholderia sp. 8Y]|nr:hypothetical protein BURKHO8Y_70036 [Burkholderia sp. 8Y]